MTCPSYIRRIFVLVVNGGVDIEVFLNLSFPAMWFQRIAYSFLWSSMDSISCFVHNYSYETDKAKEKELIPSYVYIRPTFFMIFELTLALRPRLHRMILPLLPHFPLRYCYPIPRH